MNLTQYTQNMKSTIYKIVLLLLIPSLTFANKPRGKYEQVKEASRTFRVHDDTTLNIKNKYGNVDIITWNKNSIEIDVKITVSGNNEDKVIDKIKGITIEFDQRNNDVYAATLFKNNKSSWFSGGFFSWKSNSNFNLEINYTIKMPVQNNLTIHNDYGSIILDKLDGKANINCDYGKILIGDLNNIDNRININYTNHSIIDFINKAKINADYSGFTVEESNTINLYADYSKSHFETVKKINYNCDFGTLNIGKVNTIEGDGDYISIHIKNIVNLADIDTNFGSIKLDGIQAGFQAIIVKAGYTSVKIGIREEASCSIDAATSYGSLKYYGDLFTFHKKIEKSNTKKYEGYFNKESTSSSYITVSNEFGSIKLYQK